MKSFRPFGRIGLTVLALALLAGCATTATAPTRMTAERLHPDFAPGDRATQRVLVLPVEVNIEQRAFDGNTRMTEREAAVAADLARSLSSLLSERGYAVQMFDLDAAAATAPDMRFALEQVRTAYRQASEQLYKKPLIPENKRASIRASVGPAVNRLADHADADTLLLVRSDGFENTRGLAIKGTAASVLLATLVAVAFPGTYIPVGTPVGAGLLTEVALLDGTTGDVLWTNLVPSSQAAVNNETLSALRYSFPNTRGRQDIAAAKPVVKPSPDAPVVQGVADVPALVPVSSPSPPTASPPAPPAPQLARAAQPASAPAPAAGAPAPKPAMVIALAIDEDGRDWQPGFRDASVKGALIELVPAGSDIKSWSEMVALHTIFTPLSVAAFVANWQGELVAADPRVIHSQTTAADGSITVEYESAAFREKAIRRFMRGTDGVYMLAYHTRPQAVDRAAYERWKKIIADASLEANK